MNQFYLFTRRCLAIVLMLGSLVAVAQQRTVTGKVTSADDNSPVPGVNILEKGTSNGTATDANGNYTISVGPNATLVFTFVGFATKEEAVGARSVIDVSLTSDVTALSEIVVTGYGTQEKKEITSAVASLKEKDFNQGNVTTPGQLIQGKVAGLSIVRPGGDPNQSPTFRLRGISTFGANTAPLIVLDGVVGASLDNVDPNDIQSIDVLKDGSAAAIYGARGSSGVIMVTTKSGKAGRGTYTNVDYNGFVTFDQVANNITVLSPQEFVARGGQDFGSSTNWFNELTQNATSQTHNISLTGASGNTTYRAAVNFRDNQGIVKGVDFQRLNTRLQVTQQALDGKLRFDASLAYNTRSQESINMAAFRYAVIYNPTAPIFDPATENNPNDQFGGYFQRPLFDFFNPVALARQQQFLGERRNSLANFRVEYDIVENLTASVNYAEDREAGWDGSYWSKQDFNFGIGGDGVARRTTFDNINRLLEGTLKYSKSFNKLNADFLLGAATQKRGSEGFGVQVNRFLFDVTGFNQLAFASNRAPSNLTEVYSFKNENILNSAFARINLNHSNTYFLSASVRSESFSGFGQDEKTGVFPAASAGVQLTELFDMGPVSNLKFRVSYGVTGNLPPAANLALATFAPGQIIDFDGDPLTLDDTYVSLRQARDPNPTLKWETKKEFNVGFDFGLFNNRLTGSMEYYTRNIDDLLFGINIPAGAPNPFGAKAEDGSPLSNVAGFAWANIGSLQAGGFEFIASYNDIKLGPVSWTPTVNFTIYQRTQIKSFSVGDLGISEIRLATPGSPGQNNNPIIWNRPGETLGNMYGPRYQGIDENGRYVLSTDNVDEWEVVGNGLPLGEGGLLNTFTYKNWDLNFFLRAVWGHTLYNSYRGFYENRDPASNTWNSVTTSKTPYVTQSPTFSSLFVEDASFIRLDNMSIGYNIPVKSAYLSRARVYFAGQNLFTITNYTGIDPEVRYNDTENGDTFTSNLAPGLERRNTYFTTRSLTFGVTLNFK
ncbi:MAG: TonB-dependent receptor plug domain-containing protein [Cyclobacteriaceae bacterium]|jgi:iron complex outermembrane receptor protein|nr:TonB-dependent receptor plug domain-containing protein [Cyclobacteriaceae bacterium]